MSKPLVEQVFSEGARHFGKNETELLSFLFDLQRNKPIETR
jgi:hypothetical protein